MSRGVGAIRIPSCCGGNRLPFNKPDFVGWLMRTVLLACLFGAIIVFSSHSGAHGADSVHSAGYIVDVAVIDLQCDENQTCISKPTNIVEYFGADWCSECPEVEHDLRETSNLSFIQISKPSGPSRHPKPVLG